MSWQVQGPVLVRLRLAHSHLKYTVPFFLPDNHLVYQRPPRLHLACTLRHYTHDCLKWVEDNQNTPFSLWAYNWNHNLLNTMRHYNHSTTISSNKLLGPFSIHFLKLSTVWLRPCGLTWDRVQRLCMVTPFSEILRRPPCSRSTITTAEVTFSPSDCRSFNRNILSK